MTDYESIFANDDLNLVRVLRTALEAHGFHPRAQGADQSVSFPGVAPRAGYCIDVPASEAREAKLLADALYEDMAR